MHKHLFLPTFRQSLDLKVKSYFIGLQKDYAVAAKEDRDANAE